MVSHLARHSESTFGDHLELFHSNTLIRVPSSHDAFLLLSTDFLKLTNPRASQALLRQILTLASSSSVLQDLVRVIQKNGHMVLRSGGSNHSKSWCVLMYPHRISNPILISQPESFQTSLL
jgi:hypothetical protein